MVRWVVESIPHGGPIELYLIPTSVTKDWCNKGRCMCDPVCGMVHIEYSLLLIEKSSSCSSGSGLPLCVSGPLTYV